GFPRRHDFVRFGWFDFRPGCLLDRGRFPCAGVVLAVSWLQRLSKAEALSLIFLNESALPLLRRQCRRRLARLYCQLRRGVALVGARRVTDNQCFNRVRWTR